MEIFFLKTGGMHLVEFIRVDTATNVMEVEYEGERYHLDWDDYNSYYSGVIDYTAGHVL
jgi:hypothetical protein